MNLIFDCGSTKCAVASVDENVVSPKPVRVDKGFNACVHPIEQLDSLIETCMQQLSMQPGDVDRIFFYGAGCREGSPSEMVKERLAAKFQNADIAVASDMLGAARAVCGHHPGIVGILGTGSNSCLYDGSNIVDNVSPLGYILGDEGSGAVLGKLFLGRLLKGQFSDEVKARFDREIGCDVASIIENVYRGQSPNSYLASFAPFILRCSDLNEVRDFLTDEFKRFVRYNIAGYADFTTLPIGFVGSIAYYFREFITLAIEAEGGNLGLIVKNPIERLAEYHRY